MSLDEFIKEQTAGTASGGHFMIGTHQVTVRYGASWWEWEYRGNAFYDANDLALDILRRSGADSRLTRFFLGRIPDQRRFPRVQDRRTASPPP